MHKMVSRGRIWGTESLNEGLDTNANLNITYRETVNICIVSLKYFLFTAL